MTSPPRVAQAPAATQWAVTIADYRALFGWSVEVHAGHALLNLRHGMVGVAIPANIGPRVAARLHQDDPTAPVLITGVEGWVVLADSNGCVPTADDLPPKVSVMNCPTRLPFPARDAPWSDTRWACPPDPGQRWLPTLDAVLSAVRVAQTPGRLGLLNGSFTWENQPGRSDW